MHSVPPLFAVYQHCQTNSKSESVILHLNILQCISDRIGADQEILAVSSLYSSSTPRLQQTRG